MISDKTQSLELRLRCDIGCRNNVKMICGFLYPNAKWNIHIKSVSKKYI